MQGKFKIYVILIVLKCDNVDARYESAGHIEYGSSGSVSTGVYATVFCVVLPSAIAPLHLEGTNPRNHGRENGSICVFARKTDEVETAL